MFSVSSKGLQGNLLDCGSTHVVVDLDIMDIHGCCFFEIDDLMWRNDYINSQSGWFIGDLLTSIDPKESREWPTLFEFVVFISNIQLYQLLPDICNLIILGDVPTMTTISVSNLRHEETFNPRSCRCPRWEAAWMSKWMTWLRRHQTRAGLPVLGWSQLVGFHSPSHDQNPL